MLTSTALVLLMTIPGLALFYGGMVRKKNVLATMMQSFADHLPGDRALDDRSATASPSLPAATAVPRQHGQVLPVEHGLSTAQGERVAPRTTIPESVYMCFQMTFAIITPALICRRVRRPHEVLGDAVVHGVCGRSSVYCADRALGLGAERLARQRAACSTSPAAPSCTSTPASPGSLPRWCWASASGYGNEAMPPHNLVLTRDRVLRCSGSAGSASTPAPRWRPTGARAWPWR